MAFPAAFIDELIARNPIEDVVSQYVQLSRKGSNLFGLCPFHGEKTPSFSVAPEKQIYYCFGCHRGGGVINFIMEQENLSYPDAVRFLAQRCGMQVPEDAAYQSQYKTQERLWQLCKDAARQFHRNLTDPVGAPAREYLQRRGLGAKTITRFGLGYAPEGWSNLTDAMMKLGYSKQELLQAGLVTQREGKSSLYDRFRNRLMFPIIDVRGNVIGFGGRVLDDSTPKYLNSPETVIFNKRRNLFALNIAKKSKQGHIILTEGYMDAISLHQYGFDSAVASLGTSLTKEHAALLSKYTNQVILIYDADEAGQNATNRAIPLLEKTGLQVRILRVQGAKDPDEFLKTYGADRFRLLLRQSENQAEYRLQSIARKYDLDLDEQRVAYLRQAVEMIAGLGSAVEREVYAARAAEAAKVSVDAVKLEVKKALKKRIAAERQKQKRQALAPANARQPANRSMRYQNVRSAMAEEGLIRLLLKEPALFADTGALEEQMFSVPELGRLFALLRERSEQGMRVSLAGLDETFSAEQMAHLSGVLQSRDEPVSDEAFSDYLAIITEEHEKSKLSEQTDLLSLRDRMQKTKGMEGKR